MNFREIYKRIRVFKIDNGKKAAFNAFPNFKEANCFVGYGYIDHDAGFTMEVLCMAKLEKCGMKIFEGNKEVSSKIRMDTNKIEGYYGNDDFEKDMSKIYKEKIKNINTYYENNKIKKLRSDEELDGFRHSEYIDDVLVGFSKDGYGEEFCWVRLENKTKNGYLGILLNDPNQDFRVRAGSEVIVLNYIDSHGEKVLLADLNKVKN